MIVGLYIGIVLLILIVIVARQLAKQTVVLVNPPAAMSASAAPTTSAMHQSLHSDIAALIDHKTNPTAPANLSVLYAAHADTALDQRNGLSILTDGSTELDPFEFDEIYPLFLMLEQHFPGSQQMQVIERATSTWPIGHGFSVKTYRPSLVAWVSGGGSRGCLSIRASRPFNWSIDGTELGIASPGELTSLFAIQVRGLGVWLARSASTTLVVTVWHERAANFYASTDSPITTHEEGSIASISSRLFTGNDSTEFQYGSGARRLVCKSPILFEDGQAKLSLVDNALLVTIGNALIAGQVDLVQDGKLQDGSWEQMFRPRKIPGGNYILYGNTFFN